MGDMPPPPNPHKGPHDMGGEDAGEIDPIDQGMQFWQRQANALRIVSIRNKVVGLDELRRAAEELGVDYTRLAYFDITTTALRNILIEKGIIGKDELTVKIAGIRARFDVSDEMHSP